jgi:hypothetical protein
VNIPKKGHEGKQEIDGIEEELPCINITRFNGSGLIRRFFKRHRIRKRTVGKIRNAFDRQKH